MNELTFDTMVNIDIVRSVYRGLISYAVIEGYRRYNISKLAKKGFQFIEKEFWKPSNTYIFMRPRLRYFYSIMLGSLL